MTKKIYLPLLDIENVLPILNKIVIFGRRLNQTDEILRHYILGD